MVVGGSRPAEGGELAGDRDRDDGAALAAPLIELPPDVMQALLGFPGDRDHRLLLTVLAALQHRADAGNAKPPRPAAVWRAVSRTW